MVITRHSFSPETERALAALRRLDNWHGPLALATDWAVIAAAASLCELLRGTALWWPVYLLVALPVIATRQRGLATLLHEAAHGVLTRNRRLGVLLATFPSAYLILQSYRAYRRSHLRDHHGSFGNPLVDPDLRSHIAHGIYRPMSGRTFTIKYLLAPLLGLRTPRLLVDLLLQRLSGSVSEAVVGAGVLAYFSGIGALAVVLGVGRQFALYWLVPLLLVFPLVNWYIELLEHFPLVGQETTDIRTTRTRALGPVSRHFFGIHGEGYHLDHHLSPKIPFWNLPRAHRMRMADPVYRAAIEQTAPAGRSLLWQFHDMVKRVEEGQTSARLRLHQRSNGQEPGQAISPSTVMQLAAVPFTETGENR